jgi:hypothetical protein
MVFQLYTVASGGSNIWIENWNGNVATTSGLFNVVLGTFNPMNNLAFDQQYWLGVSVNGDAEMTPRQPLTLAPYAFRAKYADTATAISIQAKAVAPTVPLDGQVLTYVAANNRWEPANAGGVPNPLILSNGIGQAVIQATNSNTGFGDAIAGQSLYGNGIYGSSPLATGVSGIGGSEGVFGMVTVSSAVAGIYGRASGGAVPAVMAEGNGLGLSVTASGGSGQAIYARSGGNAATVKVINDGASATADGVDIQTNNGNGVNVISSSGVGVNVNATGNTGIIAYSNSSYGIQGQSGVNSLAGIYGTNAAASTGSGVLGEATGGSGVEGRNLGSGSGVYAHSNSGMGLSATSQGAAGIAGYFNAVSAVVAVGQSEGVDGEALSGGGTGVMGRANLAGNRGVHGKAGVAGAEGVRAEATVPAATALHSIGNAVFDGNSNTATFNTFVSFTAGTNLSSAPAAPVSLTNAGSASTISSFNSGGGSAIYASSTASTVPAVDIVDGSQNVNGAALRADSGLGTAARFSSNGGRAIFAFSNNKAMDVQGNSIGISVTASTGTAVYARSASGANQGAIEAINDGVNAGSSGLHASGGVYGVYAQSGSGGAAAVRAENGNGAAIHAVGGSMGVSATASGPGGIAGYFQAVTGVVIAGQTLGLSVTASSATATGLYVRASSSADSIHGENDGAGTGVDGRNNGSGVGVLGWSANGYGVQGQGGGANFAGVYGQGSSFNNGIGVLAEALAGGNDGKALVAKSTYIGVSATTTGATGQAFYGRANSTSPTAEFVNDGAGSPLKINALKFPGNTGTPGQVLSTNGANQMTWVTGGGLTAPYGFTNTTNSQPTLFAENIMAGPALYGKGNLPNQGAVVGENSNSNGAGVAGVNTGSGAVGGVGVFAQATGDFAQAVNAVHAPPLGTGSGMAIYATSTAASGYGIVSESRNIGISATASAGQGIGGFFQGASTGVSGSGSSIGVYGQTTSNGGNSGGILGEAFNVNPMGVAGLNLASGPGAGVGVYGEGNSNAGIGVKGKSNGNSNGIGVYGTSGSITGYGMVAENTAVASGGSAIGLSATSAGVSGVAGYFQAVTALVAVGHSVGLSAVADVSGGTAVAGIANFGIAIYGRNMGGGGFVPSILGEATGTGMGVRGQHLTGGGQGSLGGSLSGSGSTGMDGKAGTGGIGVLAEQGAGNLALNTIGDVHFDGVGNTATFNVYVSFTAGSNLGGPGGPINVTSPAAAVAALYAFNSAGGSAIVTSGTAAGTGVLTVRNSSAGAQPYGTLSVANNPGAVNRAGVFGSSENLFTNPVGAVGVYGYSAAGTGLSGLADGVANNGQGISGQNLGVPNTGAGVRALNSSGTGYGMTVRNSGVNGTAIALSVTSDSVAGIAGHFQAVTGMVVVGTALGVSVTAPTGVGVYSQGGVGIIASGANTGGRFFGVGAPSGLGVYANGSTATASEGTLIGISATASANNGIGGHFQAVTAVVAIGSALGLNASSAIISGVKYPGGDGSNGQFLASSGTGQLYWSNATVNPPVAWTTGVAFPGSVLSVTNTANGFGMVGYATIPGAGAAGLPDFTTQVSAGVKGYTAVTNSAGVVGYSNITTTSGVGVMGIGMVGMAGFARGDIPGSVGGQFASAAVNGTALMVPQGNSIFQAPVTVTSGTPFGTAALYVSQNTGGGGGGAIYGSTPASATAAIMGESFNIVGPGPSGNASAGVAGKGAIGVVGSNKFPYSFGVVGAIDATGDTTSVGIFGINSGLGAGGSFQGLTGVVANGNNGPGSIGLLAQNSVGAGMYALKANGNTSFGPAGSTHTFASGSTVDFTGATVLGLSGSVPNPLNLTGTTAASTIFAVNNSTGTGIYAKTAGANVSPALVADGSFIGLSATSSSNAFGSAAIYAQAIAGGTGVSATVGSGPTNGVAVQAITNDFGIGVNAWSTSGMGVQAHGATFGISSTASANNGVAGIFQGVTGLVGLGQAVGVSGAAMAAGGVGVVAHQNLGAMALHAYGNSLFEGNVTVTAANPSGAAVNAYNAAGTGYAVRATDTNGGGLLAEGGNLGISATAVSGAAIYAGASVVALDTQGTWQNRGTTGQPISVGGQGRIYYDTTASKFLVSENGGPYLAMNSGAPSVPLSVTSNVSAVAPLYAVNVAGGVAAVLSGTTSGGGVLTVRNGGSAAQSYGISSITNGTAATRVGVLGSSDINFTNPVGPIGVYGYSAQGNGVNGYIDGATNTGSGVLGQNIAPTNSGAGVHGINNSGSGYGVVAENTGGGIAISATSSSANGVAGYFQAVTSVVVAGSALGISVTSATGVGIYAQSGFAGIIATSGSGSGGRFFGTSAGGIGAFARGDAAGATGLWAENPFGGLAMVVSGNASIGYPGGGAVTTFLSGNTVNFTGATVLGLPGPTAPVNLTSVAFASTVYASNTSSGAGVYGKAISYSAAVVADGASVGLSATASGAPGVGVLAFATNGIGVKGTSNNSGGTGIWAETKDLNGTALIATNGIVGSAASPNQAALSATSAASNGLAGYFSSVTGLASVGKALGLSATATDANLGIGGYFQGLTALVAVGSAAGVSGQAVANNGIGVLGYVTGTGAVGVFGESTSTIVGNAAGVVGRGSKVGVSGTATSITGNMVGVIGQVQPGGLASGFGVQGINNGGSINNGYGVSGFGPGGVIGTANIAGKDGVFGTQGGATGNGVRGQAAGGGVGVYGDAVGAGLGGYFAGLTGLAAVGTTVGVSITTTDPINGVGMVVQGGNGIYVGVTTTTAFTNAVGVSIAAYANTAGSVRAIGLSISAHVESSTGNEAIGILAVASQFSGAKATGAIIQGYDIGISSTATSGTGIGIFSSSDTAIQAQGVGLGISVTASGGAANAIYADANSTGATIRAFNHGTGVAINAFGFTSGIGIKGQVSSPASGSIGVWGLNSNAGGYGIRADNTAGNVASGGAALYITGAVTVGLTTFTDSQASGLGSPVTFTANGSSGTIVLQNARTGGTPNSYTINDTEVSSNSIVLLTLSSSLLPTGPAWAWVAPAGGQFTINFPSGWLIPAGTKFNFMVIRQ